MFNAIARLSHRNRLLFDLGVILLTSLVVLLPMLIAGIPDSQDVPQQFQFAQNFYQAIVNGEYYPSLASSPNYGYGDVSVRFYPPLAYFILSFFRYIAGNWYDATLLFFIAVYFLSGLGVYLWARDSLPRNSALFGAAVYIVLPYHVMQTYVGAVYAEFTAVALLPFCFMFISRICRNGRLIDMCGLAFFYGLLTFAHLPTILTSSLAFVVFALFSLGRANALAALLKLAAAAAAGLSLSSFYWARMITEMPYLKHNSEAYYSGIYSYNTQFILSYLFPFGAKYSSPMSLMNVIGILTIGVMIAFYVLYRTKKEPLPSLKGVTALSLFAIFMATPLSAWLWELLPFLHKIQFPFRWITLITLGTAFIAAAGFGAAIDYLATPKRYLATLAFGILLISFPYTYFRMMTPILTYPKDYLNRLVEANFNKMPSYECWWPIWTPVDKEAVSGLPRPKLLPAQVVVNDRTHQIQHWSTTEKRFTIETGEAGQAQVAALYYPHWKAEVNGRPAEVGSSDTGLISFPVPAQASEVRVFFEEPPKVRFAFYFAGVAWMLLAGVCGVLVVGNLRRRKKSV